MRLFPLTLLPLAVLSACATPQEACISNVNRNLATVSALADQTRANLNRGFAVEERQELRERRRLCERELPDGTTARTFCEEVEVIDRTVPVAIDLNAERAKLRSLEEREAQLRAQRPALIAECRAR